MTLKEEVRQYLLDEPRARERRNRQKAIANILIARHGIPTSKESLIVHLEESESINRYIRMVQQEEPATRGNDYETKDAVEQKKIIDLGYSMGFHEDIKKLNNLSIR